MWFADGEAVTQPILLILLLGFGTEWLQGCRQHDLVGAKGQVNI